MPPRRRVCKYNWLRSDRQTDRARSGGKCCCKPHPYLGNTGEGGWQNAGVKLRESSGEPVDAGGKLADAGGKLGEAMGKLGEAKSELGDAGNNLRDADGELGDARVERCETELGNAAITCELQGVNESTLFILQSY